MKHFDNLISDWNDTIGLTIEKIDHVVYDSDDPTDFHVIYFTNGKFVIQEDQPYYTTSCGLVSSHDLERKLMLIGKSKNQKHV